MMRQRMVFSQDTGFRIWQMWLGSGQGWCAHEQVQVTAIALRTGDHCSTRLQAHLPCSTDATPAFQSPHLRVTNTYLVAHRLQELTCL